MNAWTRALLGELGADVPRACIGGPFGAELTTRDYVDSPGVPVIRGSNLGGDGFVDDGFVYVSERKAKALQANHACRGDIIFTQRGTIGQIAIIPPQARHERYVLSQSQMKLTPDLSRLEPRFLLHYFRSPAALNFLTQNTLATGVPHINLSILRRVPVPLPPLPEQRRIADILDKADALRAKRRAALAQLDTLTQSIFLDMFGDPATNPKGWAVAALRSLGLVVTGGTPPSAKDGMFGGPIPFITPGDLESDAPVKRTLSEAGAKESRTVSAGATLVCCIGATIGKMEKATTKSAFNQQINAVEWSDRVNPDYGVAVMRFFKPTIVASGSSTTLPILKKSAFERVEIPVPPLEGQRAFAHRIKQVDGLRTVHNAATNELDALFASLQHRAFRGEL